MLMAKFARCYPADGLMWCQHFNGSYAPPFPLVGSKKEKSLKEISLNDYSEENKPEK